MKTTLKNWPLALTILLILFINNPVHAQGSQESTIEHYKSQKPLVLDIRFCACKAIDLESDEMEPIPSFFEQASAIKVGVLEREVGFVSSGGMTFGYSISPDKESDLYVFEHLANYHDSKESVSSQSVISIGLDSWVVIGGHANITERGTEYFSVAVKLAVSQ